MILLALISSIESLLLSIPSAKLHKSIAETHALVSEIDRGIDVYRKNGFRGKRPCKKCPKDQIRIFTIGGSSTFGLPLYYSYYTYSSVLQRLLDEGRPDEKYEVLNAGIAGYGITQVYDSIKTELKKFKPDIIMICSWFNDSSKDMNWYGMTGKSDIEAYKLQLFFRWLQKLRLFKLINNSRTYKVYSYYLLKLQPYILPKGKTRSRPRMKPEEFADVLEMINDLSKEQNFLPILITEPLNRTRGLNNYSNRNHKYYKVIAEAANKFQIQLIDTLTPIYENRDSWLFYDFIHPNERGHQIIGNAIFEQLFAESSQTPRSLEFWKGKNINLKQASFKNEIQIQLDKRELKQTQYKFNLNFPFLNKNRASLIAMLNQNKIFEEKISSQNLPFELSVDFNGKKLLPINELTIKLNLDTNLNPQFKIGSSDYYSPVYIKAVSGGKGHGWTSQVQVAQLNTSPNQRGYNIVSIDSKTGNVLSTAFFDIFGDETSNAKLEEYFLSFKNSKIEKPIIVVSVSTDGFHNANAEILSKSFRQIGGTGYSPQAFESFLLIGVPGLEPGKAYEEHGFQLIEKEIGDKDSVKASLIELVK
ncbi:MAG: hypothetical protein KDD56_03155 [Bdellovibrionales bacterium]|nr:hypothetical protein [Bdellovibrionales bacterium]